MSPKDHGYNGATHRHAGGTNPVASCGRTYTGGARYFWFAANHERPTCRACLAREKVPCALCGPGHRDPKRPALCERHGLPIATP